MFAKLSNNAKGTLLAAVGGLLLSIDVPLILLGNGDPWPVMLMRSVAVVGATALYLLVTAARARKFISPLPGWAGLLTASFYGASAVFFIAAVYLTSTANLVFILAFNPMFAALLAWFFLGERPHPTTLLTMAVMAGGVLIIVHEGLGHGHVLGDLLALATSLSLAAAITVTRAANKDMSLTPMVGCVLPLIVAAIMTPGGEWMRIDNPFWIFIDGGIVIPLAFLCLARAPAYLPAPEVAMFYMLETILAPIWVWLIFSTVPSRQSLAGGAILLIALMAHSLWQFIASRTAAPASAG